MKLKHLIIILALVGLAVLLYLVLPLGHSSATNYFESVGERELQKDEIGQFNYVYNTYEHLSFTGDEFKGWNPKEQLFWRYGIAFGAYAMPSIAMISEEHSARAIHCLKNMIVKMKSKKVWGDWTEYGLSDDPITKGNIMYKGHLNLMYGLYQLVSGDEAFSEDYTWLTNKIVDEMRVNHKEGKHEGADCEPGRYFAQCNSISLLSLKIYDQLYGTTYSEVEARWTIDFIKEKMTDKEYGFYLKMYQTNSRFCNPLLSGYTNAWSMAFLRPFDKEYNESLYGTWKDHFVKEIGPYAYVKEDPEAGASPLATMTGMMVAKEFGDKNLWNKLRNSIDRNIYQSSEDFHFLYQEVNNPIYNGPLLWTKVHVGWEEILAHNWKGNHKYEKPEVEHLAWVDILPQELFLIDDLME